MVPTPAARRLSPQRSPLVHSRVCAPRASLRLLVCALTAAAGTVGASAHPGHSDADHHDTKPATPTQVAPRQPDQILTTTYPLAYFAERIAGGLVRVACVVPAGEDPAAWTPPRDALKRLQDGELIITNGATFEEWVPTASLPAARTIDTARVFKSEFITLKAVTHSHGPQGAHTHAGTDGHTWLDPVNAVRQAEAILRAMQKRWPQHEKAFGDNFAALAADIKSTCTLAVDAAALRSVTILASHPAYNYLARRLGFPVANIDLPPDAEPTSEQWAALKAALPPASSTSAARPAIVLFESEPLPSTATFLRTQWGVQPVVFSPAETRADGDPDYLATMHDNFRRLSDAITTAARAASPAAPAANNPATPAP